ncbi:MAG: hypothetical protein A3D24_04915 [Candidatus Blackburnbacteria bacterium RIFCSPHIGHO2_02_FULL_39_13]|uniref:Peptidase M50 domain-containing protein n=1 Tax=Candidatus Blackburnbacteria bacterium RIFCSPLOWO2_01_FULL_40_20 TaxID=1797519 RepID=A0A1G1VBR1_9BACT|nr:MAG: Peptidase M50 [Microgenomates group bacterium GW2011_GWA2_39_19]OGY07125.1 MAG: hypothetical protein A2694_03585 [Candidatus Blackburnbacteria bacterium RIFCSPHIGHO2_01_FULL_40_17]OGY08947.1 MAG: hypothetical protein A3D24_04915 [Candidatus Blackburnbacteria bacterium RIFCSPHIGHO2_02_FULL_39_13]OGY12707.1 MAG: hypothetical protein A3A77_00230 [Candidatus Blackburnbacteria bacterium RIFCSPLOWO2_01_FULL_40_20]OGY15185.1 MAG: hypothetical protein A3I52_02025 [Candidatus Blackburnbacteria b
MLNLIFSDPLLLVIYIAALLLAITVHEFSHALAADKLGDPTPRVQGRLTLNPIKHLDPIGTVALILVGFGWGKPVQFDPYNLENPRRDSALISLAGPASNLIVATIVALLFRLLINSGPIVEITTMMFSVIIYLNVLLAIFNLVPIHPLDGGKILIGLLPKNIASDWDRILNQYGTIILLLLVLPIFGGAPLISKFISPTISFILNLLFPYPSMI